MPRIPNNMRPLFLKGLPSSRVLKQYANLNDIANFQNSAYKFPKVSKLELTFKKMNAYGHMGARQFWKYNLRTITFHNPQLNIDVKRVDCETKEEQLACPSVLTVHFQNGSKKTIDCKNVHSSEIMNQLIEISDAIRVPKEEIPILTQEGHEERLAKA
ncbi:hypothetical protein CANARDRAFT_7421 [[Candida] arabinofermentans NRRL YB-2248]|uniref:Ribosomal protein/NADH dehydrogenase domain-containing protein n=1 Tax=[Candida] arabinofermentans NRRL YB-2248 TaxID=983967 RepID=A0A1E4T2R8_9ASCO|nr:hypothetical protein CANARDRAFT_7421 [[Candida] arabinofermentans NRRL YB-2248]